MRKYYITGASGFVGKNLTKYLQNKNHEIAELDLRVPFNKNTIHDAYAVVHLAGKAHDLKKVTEPDDYYEVNTKLTCDIFETFLDSDASVFIFISSVKAVADSVEKILTEDFLSSPSTHYGKSKLKAEQYLFSKILPKNKKVFILRPCMIHGPENKGNLNLLFKLCEKKIPWPLGKFQNLRSFLSIENLCFVIEEFLCQENIESGIFQVADNDPVSTNELIGIINGELKQKNRILYLPKFLLKFCAALGGVLKLPLNSERLEKLTESYVVSNQKLLKVLGKPLPISSRDGLKKTIRSFVYD